jgi:hypothetical protein
VWAMPPRDGGESRGERTMTVLAARAIAFTWPSRLEHLVWEAVKLGRCTRRGVEPQHAAIARETEEARAEAGETEDRRSPSCR